MEHTIFAILFLICLIYCGYIKYKNKCENINLPNNPTIHSWIINMDKNKNRYEKSIGFYNMSNLKCVPIKRFSAIVGSELDPKEWLTDSGLKEFEEVKKNKYRTRHYQLTKGGIGCFLSHATLFKQLLNDKDNDFYLILEDDIDIYDNIYTEIANTLKDPPEDWDIILLGCHCIMQGEHNSYYYRVKSFWGTFGYLINKKGAKKFLDNFIDNKMDCQIDTFMSWLAVNKLLNIYAVKNSLIVASSDKTDIQIDIFPKNQRDAFTYRNTYLGY